MRRRVLAVSMAGAKLGEVKLGLVLSVVPQGGKYHVTEGGAIILGTYSTDERARVGLHDHIINDELLSGGYGPFSKRPFYQLPVAVRHEVMAMARV